MGQQPSAPKITSQDRAIFQLKQQRDKLKQYQKKLLVISEKQHDLARQAVIENKPDKAKFYLKLKKQQQSTIEKTYLQLDNLESLIGTIEFKLIEKDVVYGLQQGNDALKRLNLEISVEKVDKLLDDIEDETIKVNEVSDMLGSLTNSEESEVEEEFLRVQKEVTGVADSNKEQDKNKDQIRLPQAPSDMPLPDAPKSELLVDDQKQPVAQTQPHVEEPIAN
jgi:charged multivesicular body protein 6